jgi:hypothetical protein
MHQFNATQSATDRVEGFEAEHRSNHALDGPMVLLDKIIQVLALADLDFVAAFFLECIESRGIGAGAALIDGHFDWKAVLAHGFPEKAQSGLFVAVGSEQEVDGLTLLVDGTVQVCPLDLDFDIRFIHAPARADQAFLAFAESGFQLRRELPDPAVDAGMVNFEVVLGY